MDTKQKTLFSAKPEEKQQTSNKSKKITDFLEKNYAFFFAPIIVLTLYIMALINYGIYPFGDNYTVASYDLSAQICPFIEHLFDVMNGRSTLFYSHAIAGGADITGSFLYFFINYSSYKINKD